MTQAASARYARAMAKVKLSKMFVTSVTGKTGTTSWKTGASDYTLVKQSAGAKPYNRQLRTHRVNPLLVLPATLYADCDAWKVADKTYGTLPEINKMEWRYCCVRGNFSPYDMYMKSAIPHLLRGYPAPDFPHENMGKRLQKLRRPLTYFVTGKEEGCTALPPPSCITHGLHYCGIAWRRVNIPSYPAWGIKWCVRLEIGFNDGAPRWNDDYLVSITAMEDPKKLEGRWMSDLYDPEEHKPQFFSETRPTYIRAEIYPALKHEDQDHVYVPLRPDVSKMVVVELLNPAEAFVHWKRWWPTQKKDSIPENLSYLTDWPDEPPLHYWPKEYR